MQAEELVREGKLDDALQNLQNAVRSEPSNPKYRTFLFQLMSVQGDWNRALTQLNVIGELDPSALPMVQAYREALQCEGLRTAVFSGKRSPLLFGEPEKWLALLTESLRVASDGKFSEAQALRDEAFEEAPASTGTLTTAENPEGEAFEWIADGDMRLGPILEAIVNGKYYWIPFHRIHRIHFEAPVDLRDMVWTPANFMWANGGHTVGLVPTRYPGAEGHPDPKVRLARRTEWIEQQEGAVIGVGQRMLATDAGEYSLLDLRSITLDTLDGEIADAMGDVGADAEE